MLTQSLWSEGPIAWTCNFHQMHLVIKDANSFQSVLGVPDLNLVLNLTDMASCNLIKMSLIMYFNFHKDLLIKNLTNWQSCRFNMSWALILLSPSIWNMKSFALQKQILHVLYVNTKHWHHHAIMVSQFLPLGKSNSSLEVVTFQQINVSGYNFNIMNTLH